MNNSLIITNLHVQTTEGKKILSGVTMTINKGEIHAIMGPNGGGKSTLAQAVMGNPDFVITKGNIVADGEDITSMSVDQRAKHGIFLGFQYPVEVPGVHFGNFLRTALNDLLEDESTRLRYGFGEVRKKLSPIGFRNAFKEEAKSLAFQEDITKRSLNEGFSGGEKKKAEILQVAMLKPPYVILDEPDSGLDVDALRYIANKLHSLDYPFGLLLITHYQRILHYIKPDFVHVLVAGKIVKTGDANVAKEVEENGYEEYIT